MRDKIAEKIYAWLCKPEEERIVYELIDETNKITCEEIEKVENPFNRTEGSPLTITLMDGFEECRQEILALLKGGLNAEN